MSESKIVELLNDLNSPDSQQAWNRFLSEYSPHIYHVVRHYEPDLDNAADCFQFVCEQLFENGSRRLRRFKGDGAATFTTWLRAVVRNLCIDWHRKQKGRRRTFRSIARLSTFDREVFRVIYEQATAPAEHVAVLSRQFPNTTQQLIDESRTRIEEALTPQQRRILSLRTFDNGNQHQTTEQNDQMLSELAPVRSDPEQLAIDNEQKTKLRQALVQLSASERLLIRLRFEEGLTLDQLAKLLDLGNPQRVDRVIKEVLTRLRKLIDA